MTKADIVNEITKKTGADKQAVLNMQHLLIILNIVNFISNRMKFNAQNQRQCILNNRS